MIPPRDTPRSAAHTLGHRQSAMATSVVVPFETFRVALPCCCLPSANGHNSLIELDGLHRTALVSRWGIEDAARGVDG